MERTSEQSWTIWEHALYLRWYVSACVCSGVFGIVMSLGQLLSAPLVCPLPSRKGLRETSSYVRQVGWSRGSFLRQSISLNSFVPIVFQSGCTSCETSNPASDGDQVWGIGLFIGLFIGVQSAPQSSPQSAPEWMPHNQPAHLHDSMYLVVSDREILLLGVNTDV